MTITYENTIADVVLRRLSTHGYDVATGVPCSLLAGLFHSLEDSSASFGMSYTIAPREDAAVGIAVGAHLGGRHPFVLMQNSGLGYSMNVFTSLTMIYEIHPLVIMSWRGYDDTDAVEHDVIGRELRSILDILDFEQIVLDTSDPAASVDIAAAAHQHGQRAVALLVTQGI